MEKITESFSFLQSTLKKISGVDVLLGDVDPAIQSLPVIIMTPEGDGELMELATNNTQVVIPLRLNIRVDKKQFIKAYGILEKIILGIGSLRAERGYTLGSSQELEGRPRGSINPTFDERGFFQLGMDFKIQEIIIKTL